MAGTTITYGKEGAFLTVKKESDAPTMRTDKYLFFGRLDVELQAANGAGIVSGAVLQSDDLDEIDWEFVGKDNAQGQTNYFSKGDTTTFDRGAYHPVSNPLTSTHTYSMEWTSKAINWQIDGKTVRTLEAAKVGDKFPQTPMQVKIGAWVAGKQSMPQGTRDWAGGMADFSKAPFNFIVKKLTIVDYAGSDKPATKHVNQYSYGDRSGLAKSIKVSNQWIKVGDGNNKTGPGAAKANSNTTVSTTAKPSPSPSPAKSEGVSVSMTVNSLLFFGTCVLARFVL